MDHETNSLKLCSDMDSFGYPFIHNLCSLLFSISLITNPTLSSARTLNPSPEEPLTNNHSVTFFTSVVLLVPTPRLATTPCPNPRLPSLKHGGFSNWLSFLTSTQTMKPGTVGRIQEGITRSPDLRAMPIGKMQGIYVTSLADNSSHMVAIRATFSGSDDSLRFFGNYQRELKDSVIIVVGGTGRYDGANGYAVVKKVNPSDKRLRREVQFIVYLK